MSTLASLLVKNQVTGVVQIEKALQRQVIFGGDLATNLLELSVVDEDELALFTGQAFGMPVLDRSRLEIPDENVVKMFPWAAADEYRVVPISLEDKKMSIAVSSPLPESALEEVSFLLGVEFVPHIVLDFRLALALNRCFGTPLTKRFLKLTKKLAPDFEVDKTPISPPTDTHDQIEKSVKSAPSAPAQEAKETVPAETPVLVDMSDEKAVLGETDTSGVETSTSEERETTEIKSEDISAEKKVQHDDSEEDEVLSSLEEKTTAQKDTVISEAKEKPDAAPQPEQKQQQADSRGEKRPSAVQHDSVTIPSDPTFLMGPSGEPVSMPLPSNAPSIEEQIETFHPMSPLKIDKIATQLPNIEKASALLSQAGQRDDIINIFLESVGKVFEYAILFVVQGTHAKAHSRVTEGGAVRRLQEPNLNIDEGGMFKTAFETASFYLGVPGKTDADENAFQKMGRSRPRNCAILPVVLRERVILLLYGDNGALGVRPDSISELTRLTRLVAQAFDRILMEKKYGKYNVRASHLPSKPARQAFSKVPKLTQDDFSDSVGFYHVQGDDTSGKVRRSLDPPPEKNTRTSVIPEVSKEATWEKVAASVDQAITGKRPPIAKPVTYSDPPSDPIDLYSLKQKEIANGKSGTLLNVPRKIVEDLVGSKDDEETDAEPSESGDRSVVVNMKEEIDRLVERILNTKSFDKAALDLLIGIGDDAVSKLITHFPGPLLYDRYQEAGNLRRVGSHGPLLRALIAFGKKAVPHLLPLIDSHDSDVRFYSTFLFSELLFPEALDALVSRLFDRDRQVRAIAIDVIRGYQAYPEYRWAMKKVVGELESMESDLDTKQIAAGVLGELGERSAIEALIRMLNSVDAKLLKNSHRSLVKICFQDFGYSEKIWNIWYDENRKRSRIEWAIDGLTAAAEDSRHAALQALEKSIGEPAKTSETPTTMLQFKDLQKNLKAWWEEAGQELYQFKEGD